MPFWCKTACLSIEDAHLHTDKQPFYTKKSASGKNSKREKPEKKRKSLKNNVFL